VAEAASGAAADKHGYVFINGRRVRMISTKGRPTPRRALVASAIEAQDKAEPSAKPMKSPLKRKDLNHFRDLLLVKRAELVGDLNSLETEALRSSGGDLSHMPIHMADIGSDTYEQDFMLGLAENERARLREIDEALQRIEDGTYGVCAMTGNPIPRERLDAKPWAKHTIEAARLLERGGAA
jgi:DnaK suppressor protein